MFSYTSSNALATDNTSYENIDENFISENEFRQWQENMMDLLENRVTVDNLEEILEGYATENDLDNLRSYMGDKFGDLSGSITGLGENLREYMEATEEEKGKTMIIMAITKDNQKIINFGGAGGKQTPWSQERTTPFGAGSMKTVSPNSIILFMNEQYGRIGDVNLSLFYRGENGSPVLMQDYPVSGGYTWLPSKAQVVTGTATAFGFKDTSFMVRVGEAEQTGGGGGGIYANFDDHLFQADESNVVKVRDKNGNTVELDSISVSGPKVTSSNPNPSQGYVQFTVGEEGMYSIHYTVDGQSGSQTFETEGYGTEEGSGKGPSTKKIIGGILIVVAVIIIFVKRRKVWDYIKNLGSSGTSREDVPLG